MPGLWGIFGFAKLYVCYISPACREVSDPTRHCTSAGVMDVPPAVTGRRVQNSRSWHCPNPLTKPQPMRPRHHGVSENLSVSVSVCPLLQWAKSGVLDYMLWWRDSHTANPRSPVSHTDQCDVYLYVSGVNSLIWPALNSISATALQRGWHNCPCITWCCCLMAFEARNAFIVSVLKTLIHVLRIESQAWSLSALMYDSLFMLEPNQCPLTVSYGVVWSGVTVDYKNVGGLQHPWATIVPLKFRTLWLLPISISALDNAVR